MYRIIYIATAFILLFSCHSGKDTSSPETKLENIDSTRSVMYRQAMVDALKKLQLVFDSGDPEQIAGIFTYPLVDSTFTVYIPDTAFSHEFGQNGERINRTLFIKYYTPIANTSGFDRLRLLFSMLPLDSLMYQDRLLHEQREPEKPCYDFYNVEVERNEVRFVTGTNSNENYVNPPGTEEGEEANRSEYCEHQYFWTFRFDGTKLHFVRQLQAG